MYEFLDYAFYGIKQFSNYIPYTNLFKYYGIEIFTLAVVIPSVIVYMYYKTIIKNNHGEIFVLFVYSFASFITVYPISDEKHFLVAALPGIIGLIYILHSLLKEKIKIPKKILIYFISIVIVIFIILSIINLSKYLIECKLYKDINHFKYIPVRN